MSLADAGTEGAVGAAAPRRAVLLPSILAVAALGLCWSLPLEADPRLALAVFALAVIGWTATPFDDTAVALAAALALVGLGLARPDAFHEALGHDLIWLLIGAFVVAAALARAGLAERLALPLLARARSVTGLFLATTLVITASAFIVPSTSGRAALLMPLFGALSAGLAGAAQRKALALLFPSVILLSACATVIGAGAHLVTIDIVTQAGGRAPDGARWVLLGLPFALVSSLAAAAVILLTSLDAGERAEPIRIEPHPRPPLGRRQRYTLLVTLATMAGWLLAPFAGADAALVTLAGALAVTLPRCGVLSLGEALRKVEWSLILFLAATMMLGQALVETGAAEELVRRLFALIGRDRLGQPLLVATVVAALSLLAHLAVTSRTARASVLVPVLALPLAGAGYEVAGVAFLVVVGTGFCQSFTASAKPVAIYAALDGAGFTQRDLLRLSATLFPILLALLVLFALVVWPALGLDFVD